jgi:hypothetical protein
MGATSVLPGDLEGQRQIARPGLLGRVPQTALNHFVAMMAEFLGTFLFLYVSLIFVVDAADIPGSMLSQAHRLP